VGVLFPAKAARYLSTRSGPHEVMLTLRRFASRTQTNTAPVELDSPSSGPASMLSSIVIRNVRFKSLPARNSRDSRRAPSIFRTVHQRGSLPAPARWRHFCGASAESIVVGGSRQMCGAASCTGHKGRWGFRTGKGRRLPLLAVTP